MDSYKDSYKDPLKDSSKGKDSSKDSLGAGKLGSWEAGGPKGASGPLGKNLNFCKLSRLEAGQLGSWKARSLVGGDTEH